VVAANALAKRAGLPVGAAIDLVKRIPVAAGLGGGSADAAATLRVLNELWGCGLSPDDLMAIGADVGSDVPALLLEQPVVVRGRGEVIEPTHVVRTWWVVRPFDFRVSTVDAYRWWDEEGSRGPDPAPLLEAARGGRTEEMAERLFNDLELPVAVRHPQVTRVKEALVRAGALGAVMTGSGPTVAALARTEHHARDVAAAVPGSIPVSAPP
jgi:4-diphosphocytidyl-2-C-methyl-D-erythritol kinase